MSTELQTTDQSESQNTEKGLVQAFDLTSDQLPDLSKARVVPAEISTEYWSPEAGEEILCFYQGIETVPMPNIKDPEVKDDVPCAVMLTQLKDKSLKVFTNAQTRLVSALRDAQESGKIKVGTPLQITFKGKEKNKSNNMESGRWAINPLSA